MVDMIWELGMGIGFIQMINIHPSTVKRRSYIVYCNCPLNIKAKALLSTSQARHDLSSDNAPSPTCDFLLSSSSIASNFACSRARSSSADDIVGSEKSADDDDAGEVSEGSARAEGGGCWD